MIEGIIEYRESIYVYLTGILGSVILAFIYDVTKKKISTVQRLFYFVLISCPYSFIIGYRGIKVGYDTHNYVDMYKNIFNDEYNEKLFRSIFALFYKLGFTRNYGPAFTAIAFITILAFIYAVYLYDSEISIALSVFIYYMFYSNIMADQMRQVAAVSILILCMVNIYRTRYIQAIIFGIIACGIHSSAIFGLLSLLLVLLLELYNIVPLRLGSLKVYINIRLFFFIIGGISFIILGFGILTKIMLMMVPQRYISYFTTRINVQNIGLGIVSDILPVFMVLILGFGKKKSKNESVLYAYGCLGIIFRLLGYFSFFVARMAYYPNIICILMLPSYINKRSIRYRFIWQIFVVLLSIWYYLVFSVHYNQHNAFPYYSLINGV